MAGSYYYMLHRSLIVALIAAFICGLLQDTLSVGMPLGLSCVMFLTVTFVVARFQKALVPETFLTALFFGFLGGLAMSLLQYILLRSSNMIAVSIGKAFLHIIGTALFGAVSCIIVFPLARRVELFAGSVDPKEDVDDFEWAA